MKKALSLALSLILLCGILPTSVNAAEPEINWHTLPKYQYDFITSASSNYKDVWVTYNENKGGLGDNGLIRSDGTVLLKPEHTIYNWEYLYREGANNTYYRLDENGKDVEVADIGFGGGGEEGLFYNLADNKLYHGTFWREPGKSELTVSLTKAEDLLEQKESYVTYLERQGLPPLDAAGEKTFTMEYYIPKDTALVALVVDGFTKTDNKDYEEFLCKPKGMGVAINDKLLTGTKLFKELFIAHPDTVDPTKSIVAALGQNNKYGYVKTNGTTIYPFVFDMATSFGSVKNLAAVKQGNKWGFVNLPAQSAQPTPSKVLVDGKEVAFDAYKIDGANYFKLRDVAQVVNGSKKQFGVEWDGNKRAINLVSGATYVSNGTELMAGDGLAKVAKIATAALYIDGKQVSLSAYEIGGNNYFKLRDLGSSFDFNVSWDGAKNLISIDTNAGYTPE